MHWSEWVAMYFFNSTVGLGAIQNSPIVNRKPDQPGWTSICKAGGARGCWKHLGVNPEAVEQIPDAYLI